MRDATAAELHGEPDAVLEAIVWNELGATGATVDLARMELRRRRGRGASRGRGGMPPAQMCDDGHSWRGWSKACPVCARERRMRQV